MSHLMSRILLALSILTLAAPAFASYNDAKYYNAGALCTPYTSATPDYSKLRFRADGVANEGTGYQYVICSLGSDSESGSGPTTVNVEAFFRSNSTGTDQCTLTRGTNAFGTAADTASVAGIVGASVAIDLQVAPGASWPAATLVCRIAPKHTMTLIWHREEATTTDGYVYTP